jgi:hypothetical protein
MLLVMNLVCDVVSDHTIKKNRTNLVCDVVSDHTIKKNRTNLDVMAYQSFFFMQ